MDRARHLVRGVQRGAPPILRQRDIHRIRQGCHHRGKAHVEVQLTAGAVRSRVPLIGGQVPIRALVQHHKNISGCDAMLPGDLLRHGAERLHGHPRVRDRGPGHHQPGVGGRQGARYHPACRGCVQDDGRVSAIRGRCDQFVDRAFGFGGAFALGFGGDVGKPGQDMQVPGGLDTGAQAFVGGRRHPGGNVRFGLQSQKQGRHVGSAQANQQSLQSPAGDCLRQGNRDGGAASAARPAPDGDDAQPAHPCAPLGAAVPGGGRERRGHAPQGQRVCVGARHKIRDIHIPERDGFHRGYGFKLLDEFLPYSARRDQVDRPADGGERLDQRRRAVEDRCIQQDDFGRRGELGTQILRRICHRGDAEARIQLQGLVPGGGAIHVLVGQQDADRRIPARLRLLGIPGHRAPTGSG